MKRIPGKWKILGAGLLALLLAVALAVPMVGSALAATGDTLVNIPAAVVAVGNLYPPSVTFRQGSTNYGPYYNGQTAPLNAGTYSWSFSVNNYTTSLRTGFVANGTNQLNVTAADYCKRYIVIPSKVKNLDNTPGYITDRWLPNTYKFFNGDSYYLPMGSINAYYLTVNGYSVLHNIVVDCTPLQVGEMVLVSNSYCQMQINVPAALKAPNTPVATVRIYGINETYYGGETVVLPMGQTITWYLKINGKEAAHTGKPVDCTPINVTAADYCYVKNNTGSAINIYPSFTVAAGDTVLFPTGVTIEWKPTTQPAWPGTQKTVDCTPIP